MSLLIKKYYKIGKHQLFPICRSITGKGIKKTLRIIKDNFSELKILREYSGSKVFDWKIPPEWNINDAYVIDKTGKKIVDFKKNNLHIVGYSIPINKVVDKNTFIQHLHSLPDKPSAIPYITSYYKKYWGFCVTDFEKKKFLRTYNRNDKFRIVIKSDLNPNGILNYGELVLNGKSKKEILISTYICHPSLANNELSGPIVSMCLIEYFKKFKKLKKTLRFIFIPETIGSITYLNKNLFKLKNNLIAGYNLSCIGDERDHSCILSRYGDTLADKSLLKAYKLLKIKYNIHSYLKRVADQRQYCSPLINLPIASIFRSKHGEYPEYHTSLDDFNLVTEKGIKGGFDVSKKCIEILLDAEVPINKILCEPNLGKRNLYPTLSSGKHSFNKAENILNFLQYADGKNTVEEISKLIQVDLKLVNEINELLKKRNLIY